MQKVSDKINQGNLSQKEMVKLITELTEDISAAQISYWKKDEMRNKLKALKKKIDDQDRERKAAVMTQVVDLAKTILNSHSNMPLFVYEFAAFAQNKALDGCLKQVKALSPSTPAMFFSADEDTGKVLCMAQVPKDIISSKGLKANEWCGAVQGIVGGKGGGKPENAQASGNNPGALKQAMKIAIEFAEAKLGVKMPEINAGASGNSGEPSGDVHVEGFEVLQKPVANVQDGPVLSGRVGTPGFNMVLIAAAYSKLNLQQAESSGTLKLQFDAKTEISSPLAILHFLASKFGGNLLGKEKAQVLQWVMFSLNDAQSSTLDWVLNGKRNEKVLKMLEDYLKTRTYLSGERITLADISLAMALLPLFQFVMDEKVRKNYANTTRWFNTCINQPNFLTVLGTVQLCKQPVKPLNKKK